MVYTSQCFRCKGKLDPKDDHLTVQYDNIPINDPNGGHLCTISVRVNNSVVYVILKDMKVPEEVNIEVVRYDIMRQAQFLAEMVLSVISYGEGGNFSVRINSVRDQNCPETIIGPRLRFGDRGETLAIEDYDTIKNRVLSLACSNEWFQRAVKDYTAALKWSTDAPFYCYRAIESLYHHFDSCWNRMHEALGTNECVIKTLIKPYADTVRHGNDPDFAMLDETAYYALKYVRDTLWAFMINEGVIDANSKMPILDHRCIPTHIPVLHKKGCRCNEDNQERLVKCETQQP